MRATCPKCEELIDQDAAPNRMVSIVCPTCTHTFYVKSPKTIAGSGAASAPVTPPPDHPSDELKLAPETPPNRYSAPPSLPEPTKKSKFDLAALIAEAGSWMAIVLLIFAFGLLGLALMVFAPKAVDMVQKLPTTGPNYPTTVPPNSAPQNTVPPNSAPRNTSAPNSPTVASPSRVGKPYSPRSAPVRSTDIDLLCKDYLDLERSLAKHRLAVLQNHSAPLNAYAEAFERADESSRSLVRRALQQTCNREQFEAFRIKRDTLATEFDHQTEAALKSQPTSRRRELEVGFSEREIAQLAPNLITLRELLAHGYQQLDQESQSRDPAAAKYQKLLQTLNAELSQIYTQPDMITVAAQLESASDDVITLAGLRSKMSENKSTGNDQLKRSLQTHRMIAFRLLQRLEKEHEAPRQFIDAAHNFHTADRLYSISKSFTPSELAKKMTDSRRTQMGLPPQSVPPLSTVIEKRDRFPVTSGRDTNWQKTPTMTEGPMVLRPVEQTASRSNVPGPSFGPSFGPSRQGQRPSSSRPDISRPDISRPGMGRSGYRPPFGTSRRTPGPPANFMQGPDVVKIYFQKTADPTKTAKRIATGIGSKSWRVSTSGGQSTLLIQFSGPFAELAAFLGPENVISMDENQRSIRVRIDE